MSSESKKSLFGLEPDQLSRLFSLGTESAEGTEHEKEQGRTPKPADSGSSSNSSEFTASIKSSVEHIGQWIGPYKLVSILGEGGMGIVYLAEQERPIRRQVALKVIKPGMDSARVLARFEAERQALALLEHPNIAHVYQAGTTETGRPYFVMEYIKGRPINNHCDYYKLTIEDRLNLFRQVCLAIQHAHQKGIIHRDIKPSNILVSTEGEETIPKIIDFGVAKALAQPLTEHSLQTEMSQLLGTPEYMSPEQVDMANEDIDTCSDIYSLGVLLYVLLTGVLPFDCDIFRTSGIENIRQIIREIDPVTPSTRLTKLGEEAKNIAQNRKMEIQKLAKYLRKELEWIPLKAMRKERTERYQSASELACDVENYLKGAALIAGPPRAAYRLKKFVRRNRVLVTGIAAVVAVLIAGVIVSTLFAVKANKQARTSQAISDFFSNDVLAAVDPLTGERPVASLEPILDIATHRLEGKFDDEPLIEASIRYRLGRTYWHLGKYDAAEANLRRAVELRGEQLGTKDREVLNYMQELGWVYFNQTRYDQAERLLVEAVNHMRFALDEFDPALAQAIIRLGWLYRYQGRYKEAEKIFAERLAACQRRLGPDSTHLTPYLEGLGIACLEQGRLEQAEQFCRKAVEINRRARGDEHNDTLNFMRWLGAVYCELDRYEDAEELFLKALEVRRRVLGDENPRSLILMRHLGSLYTKQGRFVEAEQFLIPALESHRRLFGNDDQETLHSMLEVAKLYRAEGHCEKAEPLLLESCIGRLNVLGPDHPACFESMHELAVLYKEQSRYEEAEKYLLEAVEGRRLKLGDTHPHTIESIKTLIDLYEAWNEPEKAKEWRTKIPQI